MQGYETLWLPGMDHASIAVHALVERALEVEGTSRRELGREAFVDRTWAWKAEHGGAILGQMRRLGESVDWTRERFTMDPGLNRAVVTIFKRLYDDGLIYRAERMVNWSPEMRSVLSDIEVEHREVDGELVSIRYGDGEDSVVVSTTRVETMLGDTAVAVHPDDERYAHLVGREIELPLVGRKLRVVADEHVDPGFGSGALKVTPAHDPNDFEIGRRHGLPMPTIMDESGRIANSGTEFDGLDRFAGPGRGARGAGPAGPDRRREAAVPAHRRASQRSKEPIEPRLSLQWFVKAGRSAGRPATRCATAGSPCTRRSWSRAGSAGWTTCTTGASPASCGGGTGSRSGTRPTARRSASARTSEPPAGWTQDEDVLDTWFSSALWPFSTLGWPDQTAGPASASTRTRCWSPATTSCSSGWPG